jgi:predicted dehydrogenase
LFPEHRYYDLVCIAEVNVYAFSAEHPKTRVFADYRHLLDEARPEAVIIASPNQMHAETGIECARRGIHILIEKPVTDTIESAAALMAEVRKGGIKSLVGHHRRHHLQVKTLKALLGEGRIGDVVGVSAIWATHKLADYFRLAPWRTQPGGARSHQPDPEIDFLRFTVGEYSRGGDRLDASAVLRSRIPQWR